MKENVWRAQVNVCVSTEQSKWRHRAYRHICLLSLLCFGLQLQPDLHPLPAEHLVLNLQSVPVRWDKLYKSSRLYVMNRCGSSVSDVDAAVGNGSRPAEKLKGYWYKARRGSQQARNWFFEKFLTQPCAQSCSLQPLLLHPLVQWFQDNFKKWPHLVTVKAPHVFSAGIIKLRFDLWLLM